VKRALVLGAILTCGCGSEPAPVVEILEVTPDAVVAALDAQNDVTLRLHYSDEDGDLGDGIAEIHDCRVEGLVTRIELPPIANENATSEGVAIEGELSLLVEDISELEPGAPGCAAFGQPAPAEGELTLCAVLIDAAGHASAADCTDGIHLTPNPSP
jgi:hypothetical protein